MNERILLGLVVIICVLAGLLMTFRHDDSWIPLLHNTAFALRWLANTLICAITIVLAVSISLSVQHH